MSSACGPDANHQANWEIAISYTDTYAIPVGGMVANVQTALHLSNYGNFTPGTSKWYSPCLTGTSYAANNHFALYYQGNLVISSGGGAPVFRGAGRSYGDASLNAAGPVIEMTGLNAIAGFDEATPVVLGT